MCYGQQFSTKKIFLQDTVTIDTVSFVSSNCVIKIGKDTLPNSYYKLFSFDSKIVFNLVKLKQDYSSVEYVEIIYQKFPILFSKKIKDEKKYSVIQKKDSSQVIIYNLNDAKYNVEEPFTFGELQKSGSITRGVSLGNTQDASVISNFNLQLSGKIAEDVELLASITDENVPFQPQGNTQSLQDFDKIFIQLTKGSSTAIGGDFTITKPTGYFLNMLKRTQGLSLSTKVWNKNIFKNNELVGGMKFGLHGGVARGKFRRQEFMGVEGNQGPYRLTGNDGELQLVILSGSEAVYIDGKKLERGQENDYIIDYNTAEISFTAKQIITKDKRIVIEFEYSDRKYQRWQVHFNHEWDYKKISYRINYFGEFDDRNSPLIQSLNDDDRIKMSGIGDTLLNAFIPAIDSVAFSNAEVLYKKVDTIVNLIPRKIFVYSTSPDSARFRLSFSNVGKGNGDYVLLNNTANGRVYKWVTPNADGSKNGEYEPLIKLVTPKSYHIVTAGFDYRINRKMFLSAEGAFSSNDKNTFSDVNDNDNLGYAFKIDARYSVPLIKKEKDTLKLNVNINYEQVSENFTPVIRFRTVEFGRDWNLTNTNNPNQNFQNAIIGNDYIPNASIDFRQNSWGSAGYYFSSYFKGDLFSAYRNQLKAIIKKRNWTFNTNIQQTSTRDTLYNTLFLRQRTNLSKKWNAIQIGLNAESEWNEFRINKTDSLRNNSYGFNDVEFFVSQGDSLKVQFRVFYKARLDHVANQNEMRYAAIAHHAGIEFKWLQNKWQNLKSTITYRALEIIDTVVLKKQNESTVLGRIEYNAQFFEKSIQLNLFYESGSGLENKRDYQYIQALNNQGTHVWIDYNNNNVKERDEYEIRTGTIVGTDGLTYIQFYFPTNEFIRTYYNQFTATLNLQTPNSWRREKGFKKILSRLSAQTSFKSDRKTQQDDFLASLNPFGYDNFDTNLVSSNYSFRQTIYINKSSSVWSADLNYNDINNKNLFSNGIDSRSNKYFSSRIRVNFLRMFTIQQDFKYGTKSNVSQLLRTRNFNVEYIDLPVEFYIQPNSKWRISASYRFSKKDNVGFEQDPLVPKGQKSVAHDVGVELKTNFILKGQLTARFNYINVQYNDVDNNQIAFEMLEGLRTGDNYTWQASFQRMIGKNLQLTLQYDGRKSANLNIIHLGSMQVRAFF